MTTRTTTAALHAFVWTAVFIAWHGYWALGGDFGFGDQEAAFPDAGWAFTAVVATLFAAGLAVPLAVARGIGPRRALVVALWIGAVILGARGLSGLADDALRFSGLVETGLTGLSDERVLGTAHPSDYTMWSTIGIDAFFAAGGLLFARAARGPGRRRHLPRPQTTAWAGYAASAWAIAYAVGVRGYQGLGGTVGLAGTFEDPTGFRQASLLAGAFLLLVGVGALAFVRPWGLLIPRWLVIVPALLGAGFAAAHALTAYVTKPLHLLGAVDIEFPGWERLDEHALIWWDLLFYEPWFLGLGVLVMLGARHHYRRTGGTHERRLIGVTVAGTLALTALSVALVV